MKSNESLDDINSFSKRKLIYLCNQLDIPLPMNPTRDLLIQSIESYKEKNRTPILTPVKTEGPEIENKKQRNFMHTPRVLNSTKAQILPTPVTVYAESYSPSYQNSRSPTPSSHFFSKKSIFYPIDNDVIFYFLVFIIVCFCILLLIFICID